MKSIQATMRQKVGECCEIEDGSSRKEQKMEVGGIAWMQMGFNKVQVRWFRRKIQDKVCCKRVYLNLWH